MLVAGIVVDVDGNAAERGDFGAEGREGGVVLSVGECGMRIGTGKCSWCAFVPRAIYRDLLESLTFRVRRLPTWLQAADWYGGFDCW
jgi:hypothetical protein